jgi:hypothetical protein
MLDELGGYKGEMLPRLWGSCSKSGQAKRVPASGPALHVATCPKTPTHSRMLALAASIPALFELHCSEITCEVKDKSGIALNLRPDPTIENAVK